MSDTASKHCLHFVRGKCRSSCPCRWLDRKNAPACTVSGLLERDALDRPDPKAYLIENAIKGGQFA
jgi:hypothetical protein